MKITFRGSTASAYKWARSGICQVSAKTLRRRIEAGWPSGTALTTPYQNRGDGEEHYRARLTAAAIPDIRERGDGGESYASIAEDYGVHRRTIRDVVERVTWKSVPERGDDDDRV
jgi:hypothetical protein